MRLARLRIPGGSGPRGRTVANLGGQLMISGSGPDRFTGGAKGTRTPDPPLANYTRTDRDIARRAFTPSLCSARPLLFGAVATGTSYRDVYRLLRFIESTPLTGACPAMISPYGL